MHGTTGRTHYRKTYYRKNHEFYHTSIVSYGFYHTSNPYVMSGPAAVAKSALAVRWSFLMTESAVMLYARRRTREDSEGIISYWLDLGV